MDKAVKSYIEKQKSPQKEILKKIRRIFLKTLPSPNEEAKWGVVAFAKNKFYIAALKDKVHIGFAITGLNKNEIKLFEGSGKTMRHIKIKSLKDINEKELTKIIKLVNKNVKCKA